MIEKHVLSKSTFIRGTQCLKSLYLNKKRPFLRDRLSDEQRAIFKRGTDVGVLAQQLFPNGVDLKPKSPSQFRKKVAETTEIVNAGQHNVLYEAAFQHDGLLILLDILVKEQNEWVAYEVKSSLKISETYLKDAAFQYYVMHHAGLSLKDFYLVTLNPDYQFEGTLDIKKLFVKHRVTDEVIQRQPWIEEQVKAEKETLLLAHSPDIAIGPQCHNPYPCDFQGHCWKKVADNSVLFLDAFDESFRFESYYSGNDAPEKIDYENCTPKQQIQLQSARTKKYYFHKTRLKKFVDSIPNHARFLSIRFVRPAVPCFPHTKAYQHIPVALRIDDENEFPITQNNPMDTLYPILKTRLDQGIIFVTYDASGLLSYLTETKQDKLRIRLQRQLIDLKEVFNEDILFHYQLKGDYSPMQVAKVILKKWVRELNPSLLTMEWQKNLFNQAPIPEELMEQTELYLKKSNQFLHDFVGFMQHEALLKQS
jgi:hypothetical protein